jgi:hypothetical protein
MFLRRRRLDSPAADRLTISVAWPMKPTFIWRLLAVHPSGGKSTAETKLLSTAPSEMPRHASDGAVVHPPNPSQAVGNPKKELHP